MSVEQRYRPQDECPLFSERLEDHIVAYTRGEAPNRGRFCGNCYTPLSPDSTRCPHCNEPTEGAHPPVAAIPEPIVDMLRRQRKTESTVVNAFAFLGLAIALVGGLGFVLWVPWLRNNLIAATIAYAFILLVGGRVLAAILGGYYGDRLAYERARKRLRGQWADWVRQRDGAAAGAS